MKILVVAAMANLRLVVGEEKDIPPHPILVKNKGWRARAGSFGRVNE
jgi:hypothetical protein